jgi:hypothetical protein
MGTRVLARIRRGHRAVRRDLALGAGTLVVLALAVGAPAASAHASSPQSHPASRAGFDMPPPPPRVDAVAVQGGVLYVRFDESEFNQVFDPATESLRYVTMTPGERNPITPVTESCVVSNPHICYGSVAHRLAIDESIDGGSTWSTAWEVSEPDRVILAHNYDAVRLPGELFISSVAVAETIDGYVVLAAAGADGLVVRHEDGTWERIGLTTGRVPALGADPWLWKPYPVVWAFVAFCLLLVVFGEARGLRDRYAARVAFGWLLSALGLLLAYWVARMNGVGPKGDTLPDAAFWESAEATIALVLTLAGVAVADGALGALYARALALAVVGSLIAWKAAALALDPGHSLWNAGWVAALVVAEFAIIGAYLMRLGKPHVP